MAKFIFELIGISLISPIYIFFQHLRLRLLLKAVVELVMPHQIKFFSWQICRKKPTKWCFRCCSINFPDLKKFVWFPDAMTLLLSNLKMKCNLQRPEMRCKDSKSRPMPPWKSVLLRNKCVIFSKLYMYCKCALH